MTTTLALTPLAQSANVRRVLVQRWKMAGNHHDYAYNVLVQIADADPATVAACHSFVHPSGFGCKWTDRFMDYAEATCPLEQRKMELGWDRYDAWMQHDERASKEARRIASTVFPELENGRDDRLPTLWASYDRPLPDAADAWVEIPATPF